MRFRKDGINSIARAKATRDILAALPGIWTKSLTEETRATSEEKQGSYRMTLTEGMEKGYELGGKPSM